MRNPAPFAVSCAVLTFLTSAYAGTDPVQDFTVLKRPLSKVEALNLAIAHNGIILQAQKDVEAAAGVAVQTRAILYPKLIHSATYQIRQDSLIEANQDREIQSQEWNIPGIGTIELGGGTYERQNNQYWSTDIHLVQSIYEGGRMRSATRSSKLIREQALLVFQSTVADTLLSVSNAYDDVIRAKEQVTVRKASTTFLGKYLDETKTKNEAGSVPEFDVLRQEVELANALAEEVRAIGDYRVSKQKLVQQLGYNVPAQVSDDLSLNLTTPLQAHPFPQSLPEALALAVENRTEIAALMKEELLRNEAVIVAKAGTKPSVQAFAGYELTSRLQTRNAGDQLHGALVGAQMSWPIFDGFLTKGRVDEATALRGKAAEAKAETTRVVELQVRTAWSELRTAKSVLAAQSKNVDKAVRALELALTRYNEGAGTQIDVLSSQTALTDARGSYVDAQRDYSVAYAGLRRATGADLQK